MAKRIRNKTRFTVWVVESFARAIAVWLKNHPGANRTDFVNQALAKKIEKEGLKLPVDLGISIMSKEALQHESSPLENLSETKLGPRRSRTVLISTWLDPRLVSAVDKCVEKYKPDMNRSDFFTEAAAETLKNAGLISRAEFIARGIRRPLNPEADQILERYIDEMRTALNETREAFAAGESAARSTKSRRVSRKKMELCLEKMQLVLSKYEKFDSHAEKWGIIKDFGDEHT
jgi:hypothetical protein